MLVLTVAVLASAPAAAGAPARAHVLVAVTGDDRDGALERLGRRGDLSLALMSAALGSAPLEQTALDVSQGARVDGRLLSGPPPSLRLVADPRGTGSRLEPWDRVRRRADEAPATLEPGLLAETVRRAGGHVALVGSHAAPEPSGVAPGGGGAGGAEPSGAVPSGGGARSAALPEGLAAVAPMAADRRGRVERVELTSTDRIAAAAVAQWRRAELVVAALPAGRPGRLATDALLAARRQGDVLLLLVRPSSAAEGLWLTALAAPGGAGTLRSPATRQTGLVIATDAAPTMLSALRLPAPRAMQGRVLERRPGRDPERLAALAQRIESLGRRRFALLPLCLAAMLLVLIVGLVRSGREGGWAAARLLVLAALWSPTALLATAALLPAAALEMALTIGGSLALAAVTERVLPWPRGPALPALVGLGAHALDLGLGSRLVLTSLAGINPLYGARFYGIGNQLEAILAVVLLLGAGAALSRSGRTVMRGRLKASARRRLEAPARRRPGAQAVGFALACLAGVLVIGPARLGADVGGVITLSAGAAGAVATTLGGRGRRLALLALLVAPVVAVGALALIDLATGGSAHLTRSVLDAGSWRDLLDVLERRVRLSFAGLDAAGARVGVALSVAALALAAWRWRALLELLRVVPAYGAGLAGALAATVVGTLANDSGPTILVIGTCGLALGLLYARAAPSVRADSSTLAKCESPSYRPTPTATRGA